MSKDVQSLKMREDGNDITHQIDRLLRDYRGDRRVTSVVIQARNMIEGLRAAVDFGEKVRAEPNPTDAIPVLSWR